jgi:cardiolipin synthase
MSPALVPSQTYTKHVTRAIGRATRRICVLALIIEQEKDGEAIITALVRAASRGVSVSVLIDFSTYSFQDGHINPYYGYIDPVRSSHDMTNRLRAHGVSVQWLGAHNPFLFAGRTHSKWIVADDIVFCFGGINLHADFTSDRDYMFMFRDSTIATIIADEHRAIATADDNESAYMSKSISTALGDVLIDGGIPFDSIIYRRAVSLVEQAKHVIVVTQYCPTGKLATAIAARSHEVYYNAPSTQDPLTNALISYGEKRSRITNLYQQDNYLHAKYILVTHPDGHKTAITGSHNFISYGGILGTREIALMTDNEDVISSLESFYSQYIALRR